MLIVDRVENGLAVCEGPGRVMVTIPLSGLPPGVREGDCLCETAGGYAVDAAETARRKQCGRSLFDRLRKSN